jgi:hypothetical protein
LPPPSAPTNKVEHGFAGIDSGSKRQGDAAQGHRIADELTGDLFSGGFEIVSAPGAVPWEITVRRAPGKGEHGKSRADNLSHYHKSPYFEPAQY